MALEDEKTVEGEELNVRNFGLSTRKEKAAPKDERAEGQAANKEGEPEDLICPWCGHGKLSAKHSVGAYDGLTSIGGACSVSISCSSCGLKISVAGYKGKEGIARALAPIRELIDLREAYAILHVGLQEIRAKMRGRLRR